MRDNVQVNGFWDKVSFFWLIVDIFYAISRNGNITLVEGAFEQEDKRLWWDEVNRLRLVRNEEGYHYYLYDASGERIIKAHTDELRVYQNGQPVDNRIEIGDFKLYPNAYLTVDDERAYTKHYFASGRRIAAQVKQGVPFMQYLNRPTPAKENTRSDISRKIRNLPLQRHATLLRKYRTLLRPARQTRG
ncbi:MAG: hypothetical protein GXO24_00810, partial [Chlorobi bacterium]|nr:hypothetical protein [Chlorobiota bacterium]